MESLTYGLEKDDYLFATGISFVFPSLSLSSLSCLGIQTFFKLLVTILSTVFYHTILNLRLYEIKQEYSQERFMKSGAENLAQYAVK